MVILNRSVFKLDELGAEIARIAFPAALALTADPIASLIDTAFIGQIGIHIFPIYIFNLDFANLNLFMQDYISFILKMR